MRHRPSGSIRARRLFAAVLASFLAFASSRAGAEVHDHLECFKVKDSASFAATVTLTPLDTATLPVEAGCTVKVRSRQLCFPVEKQLITTSGPRLAFDGQELANAFLCYSVKCPPSELPASVQMSDQFGTRIFTGLRRTTICAPAVSGVPPTTTTLPPPAPRDCADATPPNCDGTCNDFNLACVPDNGACICQYVDVWGACPMVGSGVPECLGSCQGSQTCLDAGGGACQCGTAY